MANTFEFKIPGKPIAKSRPRLGRNGHVYTPKPTRIAEALVKFYGLTIIKRPLEEPLSMRIRFGMPIPKSYSKKQRKMITDGQLHHCKTPDIDNLAKLVLDGLNGVAYVDDKQIISLTAEKFYAEIPGTTVQISEWSADNDGDD